MNVCARYYPGQVVLAYNIYNDTIAELKSHGYPGKPVQETVARRYREVKALCGMESATGKGEYRKKPPVPVAVNDGRKNEQQSLF